MRGRAWGRAPGAPPPIGSGAVHRRGWCTGACPRSTAPVSGGGRGGCLPRAGHIFPYIFPCPVFRFGRRHTHRAIRAGNHVGEGGLWHLGDALRSRRVDLDGGGRARGAVSGRRQPPSTSRRRLSKAGGIIGCCSQAAADKDMNNIPAQAVVARAAAGGAINPLSAPLHVRAPSPTQLGSTLVHPRPPHHLLSG